VIATKLDLLDDAPKTDYSLETVPLPLAETDTEPKK